MKGATTPPTPMPPAHLAPFVAGMRALKVFTNNRMIGYLAEFNDIWQFEYTQEWVEDPQGWSLSPGLPRGKKIIIDGSTNRPVQWYFDNLLPEEGMRSALAKTENLPEADSFALIERLGAESAGSLTMVRTTDDLPDEQGSRPLPDAELSHRIQQMPRVPIASTGAKRMSMAGAQHKLMVGWDGASLTEPIGLTPSTHILKPDHPSGEYPHTVINEYSMMTLARRLGLQVPQVWRHYCPEPVYIVERFDRHHAGEGTLRLHAIDSCQLLNKARTFKYNQARLDTLEEVINFTRNRVETRVGLFRWLVFNVIIGNHDNHLKNISFLANQQGVRLAPAYDLLCTAVYHTQDYFTGGHRWPDIELAIPLPGQTFYAEINRRGLIEAGRVLGLSENICQREVGKMTERAISEMDDIIVRIAQENTSAPEEVAAYHAGEMRLLRAIRHIVISEMVQKMK